MKTIIIVAAALLYAPLAGAAYKCVDEKGTTRFGETPPDECAHVVMYETKPNGKVIRKIEPTPSPDQVKQLKEEGERKRAADKVAAEQKRKDGALLNTYSSDREIDVTRDRNIEPIRNRINNSKERLKSIDVREAKIAEEMEFYKAGKKKTSSAKHADEPPAMLVAEQESLAKEKAGLSQSIVVHEKEIEALRARFDLDKKRWLDLKSAAPTAQAEPSPGAAPSKANRKY